MNGWKQTKKHMTSENKTKSPENWTEQGPYQ